MHAPLPVHAIDRLVRFCPYGPTALAALHIALPERSVVGLDAQFDPSTGTASWRSAQATIDSVRGNVAEQVHALVSSAWEPTDEPVDGDTPVLKTLRSGAYHVAFGAELYLERTVLVESTFSDPAAVAYAYVDAIAQQHRTSGSGVQLLAGSACLIHDDGRSVLLSHPAGARRGERSAGDPRDSIDAVAAELAVMFDVDGFDAATLGSRATGTVDVDYVATWTEQGRCYDIIIPATLGAGTVLGAPYGAAAPVVQDWYGSGNRGPWYDLADYEPIAAAAVEPGWLARHRTSGIVVLLRSTD